MSKMYKTPAAGATRFPAALASFASLERSRSTMARGSTKKHSKQAGTLGSESPTHAERKALGYGTVRERLGKETVKDFDVERAHALATARDAVCTPRGVVYDREAIFECLVAQKATYERELRAWSANGRAPGRRRRRRRRRGENWIWIGFTRRITAVEASEENWTMRSVRSTARRTRGRRPRRRWG